MGELILVAGLSLILGTMAGYAAGLYAAKQEDPEDVPEPGDDESIYVDQDDLSYLLAQAENLAEQADNLRLTVKNIQQPW
jgi:hypothetical protein